MNDRARRILVMQYAGDWRAAYRQLEATGTESYYGHRYVLEQLAALAREVGETMIVCGLSDEDYRETLPSGVIVAGIAAHPDRQAKRFTAVMDEFDPTDLIVLGPMPHLIRWGLGHKQRVLCIFADSFNTGALRRFLRYGRLAHLLNQPGVNWVANHGENACRSLAAIGVDPAKVVAWDWPHQRDPAAAPVRASPSGADVPLVYVGVVQAAKGVGEAIDAVAALRARGIEARLDVVGAGELDAFRTHATRAGVAEHVAFRGRLANAEVVGLMRSAFAVVVPSRHNYPEGLPLTIYEALSVRTPIVASDHPMFRGRIIDGESALIFPAGDGAALAAQVARLHGDPSVYRNLSENAAAAWRGLQIDTKWGELVRRWIDDTPADRAWIAARALAPA